MKTKYRPILLLLSLGLFVLSGCASSSQSTISITTKYSPRQMRQDLDFLVKTDEQVHPDIFVHTPEAIFDSVIAGAQGELDGPMTALQFYKVIAPVQSSLKDGHTYVIFPYQFRSSYLKAGGKIIPFDVRVEGEKILIRKNYSSDSTLAPDSQILSINSVGAGEMTSTLRKYTYGEFESLRNSEMGELFKPLVWAVYGFDGPFTVKYISSVDGRTHTDELPGITEARFDSLFAGGKNIQRQMSLWDFKLLEGGKVALIDMRSFGASRDLSRFRKFLDSSFAIIKDRKIENLIIDVRNNGGGESELTEALINFVATKPWVLFSRADWKMSVQAKAEIIPWYLSWIPIKTFLPLFSFMYTSTKIKKVEFDSVDHELLHVYSSPGKLKSNPLRFEGHTYVLINRGSFSASVLFAAVMKDYHFATLIGQETGQSANPFGGNYFFTLPNTHLRASVPTGRNYRPSGRVTGKGVMPDYTVEPSPAQMAAGTDLVMKFTEHLIALADSTAGVRH